MATPDRKHKKFTDYLKWAAPAYVVLMYLVCQILKTDESLPLTDRIDEGLLRVFKHPFDIFPINWKVMGVFLYLGLLALGLLYVEYARRKQMRPGVDNGSSTWNEDLKGYNKQFTEPYDKPYANKSGENNKNIILTQDVFLGMDGRKTMRNLNVLVAGGSGSGKSRFVVKPNILQANCNYVITDPKGELLESTGSFLEKQGYKIKVFNLSQMEHSCSYNPFHYIRDEAGVLTMLNALIQNTTPPDAHKGDPFWENAEKALLGAICFYLYYECKEEDQNFSNVMKLLRCLEVREGQEDFDSTLDIMFKMLKEKDPENIAVRQYAVFKSAGGGKTAQSIMISCQTRLQVFNLKVIHNLTGTDNIDLLSVAKEKTALFCITPVQDKTFNFLVALLYTQLFETLYSYAETECDGRRLPHHVRFLLDEFANIGTIPEFEMKLATIRSYEMSCTIIIQNLAQLKTMYKDNYESIIGNCDTILFLGGQEQGTLDWISKKLGKETIRVRNSSRNLGGRGGGGNSLSYNTTGRELMMPDEISRMDTSYCILFIRGLFPFYGKKYDYPKHPNYKYTGDAHKKLKYDVAVQFNTEKHVVKPSPYAEEKRRIKVMSERSDNRESEKVDRMAREIRKVPRTHSVKGQELYKDEALEETFVKSMAQKAVEENNHAMIVEENLSVADGYAPTPEEAFSEFYTPTEEEFERMYEEDFGVDDFSIDDDEEPERSEQ